MITTHPRRRGLHQVDLQAQSRHVQASSRPGPAATRPPATSPTRTAPPGRRRGARGAGLVTLQVYATVTVVNPDDLPAAAADLEHRAEQSRIRLRRLYGSQAAGFATGLSLGATPELLRGRR